MYHNRMEKRLRFENLEQKRMLAADLTVEVIDGDLVITGDAEPSSFFLESGDDFEKDDQFFILNRKFGDTINGQYDELYVSGVTGDVIINTGGGDDIVRIFGGTQVSATAPLNFPGGLKIDLGDGQDQLYMGAAELNFDHQLPLNFAGDLILEGGAGDDFLELTALQVADDFDIVDTEGSNFVNMVPGYFFSNSIPASTVGGDFTVLMGSGSDQVNIVQTEIGNNLIVATGEGDDVAYFETNSAQGSSLVSLGDGINQAVVFDFYAGAALSVVGSGSNFIALDTVTSGALIAVATSDGSDSVTIVNSTTELGLVSTGSGSDGLDILDSAFEALAVELGQGDDTLTLGGVEVSLLALLRGGQGNDIYRDLGGNDINWELDFGFEIYEDLSV